MVMRFLMLLLIPFGLYAIATNNVDAEVQWDSIYANTPYTVTISVTHDSGDKIDPMSFTANNKKINPVFLKSVKMSVSSPLEISMYTIEMPGMPQGLQLLPTFSVKMNGTVYSSIPSGFEVKAAPPPASSAPPPQAAPPQAKPAAPVPQKPIVSPGPGAVAASQPALKLEAIFTGTVPLYPGQRFYLGYRYLYNTSVDLSEEKLPLLEAKGFKKIGDKQIDNGVEQGASVTQVVQKVESETPGKYIFPASQIVGYAYKVDSKGQKIYDRTSLTSSLPSFEIQVLPFPEQGKPASFQGAIGNFDFQAKLISPTNVQVGDKIQLQLTVTGTGELEQLLPPDLCCQPGFSGFFKPSDLPPVTKIQGDTKTFLIELFVQNSNISSIPPIEFSFFNPSTKTYEKKVSAAIPLNVTASGKTEITREMEPSAIANETSPFSPISVRSSYAIPLGLITLIGLALLALQAHYHQQKKEVAATITPLLSKNLYNEAKQQESHPDLFYPLAIKAIRQKMWEEKQIDSVNVPLDKIPDSALKTLLVRLENTRFSREAPMDIKETIQQLEGLFQT